MPTLKKDFTTFFGSLRERVVGVSTDGLFYINVPPEVRKEMAALPERIESKTYQDIWALLAETELQFSRRNERTVKRVIVLTYASSVLKEDGTVADDPERKPTKKQCEYNRGGLNLSFSAGVYDLYRTPHGKSQYRFEWVNSRIPSKYYPFDYRTCDNGKLQSKWGDDKWSVLTYDPELEVRIVDLTTRFDALSVQLFGLFDAPSGQALAAKLLALPALPTGVPALPVLEEKPANSRKVSGGK